MLPIHTSETNNVLGAPPDWNEKVGGPCVGLPVMQDQYGFWSFWQPTFRERLALIFGRKIALYIFGHAHPPIKLGTALKSVRAVTPKEAPANAE